MKNIYMNVFHVIRSFAATLRAKVAEHNSRPDFKVIAAHGGAEIGAAWLRSADNGASYIEVSLKTPAVGTFKIVYNKQKRLLW